MAGIVTTGTLSRCDLNAICILYRSVWLRDNTPLQSAYLSFDVCSSWCVVARMPCCNSQHCVSARLCTLWASLFLNFTRLSWPLVLKTREEHNLFWNFCFVTKKALFLPWGCLVWIQTFEEVLKISKGFWKINESGKTNLLIITFYVDHCCFSCWSGTASECTIELLRVKI